MKKYYGVAVGRQTGVFESWDEAKPQVDKFNGAKFRGFSTKEDAWNYVKNGGVVVPSDAPKSGTVDLKTTCVVYVDGFIEPSNNSIKIGGVIDTFNGLSRVSSWSWADDYESTTDLDILCYGYVNVLANAYKNGCRSFLLIYKNQCIEGWAETWKARSEVAKYYKKCIELLREHNCSFSFVKFDGTDKKHTLYRSVVKEVLKDDCVSENYTKFGFKSSF